MTPPITPLPPIIVNKAGQTITIEQAQIRRVWRRKQVTLPHPAVIDAIQSERLGVR